MYIGVSTTGDPTGSYYTYTFTSPEFPDYLKFSVWTDGYYMTSNQTQRVDKVGNRTLMHARNARQAIESDATRADKRGTVRISGSTADGDCVILVSDAKLRTFTETFPSHAHKAVVIPEAVSVTRFQPGGEPHLVVKRLQMPHWSGRHGAEAGQRGHHMAAQMPPPAPLRVVPIPALTKDARISEKAVVILMRLEISHPFLTLRPGERLDVTVKAARHRGIAGAVKRGLRHLRSVAIAPIRAVFAAHGIDVAQRAGTPLVDEGRVCPAQQAVAGGRTKIRTSKAQPVPPGGGVQ